MGKPDRHNRKRRKRLEQSLSQRSQTKRIERFQEGDSYIATWPRVRREENQRHRSLLAIKELAFDSPLWGLQDDELLKRLGYSAYKAVFWDIEDDGGYSAPKQSGGGSMLVVKDAGGRRKTVVFIRKHDPAKENPPTSPEALAALDIMALYHELGHVSDFENAVNYVPGKQLDLAKAEAYAHHYACKKLMAGNFRLLVAHYLREWLGQLSASSVETVRDAAVDVLRSPECVTYKAFAGPFLDEDRPMAH